MQHMTSVGVKPTASLSTVVPLQRTDGVRKGFAADFRSEEGLAAHELGIPEQRRAKVLDYDADVFLRFFNLLSRRPVHSYTMRQLRQLWRILALGMGDQVPLKEIRSHTIEGPAGPIGLKIYIPRDPPGPLPVFVWCH